MVEGVTNGEYGGNAGATRVIPLFPLPVSVLFPHMPLPLHIFEVRYRHMVADVLDGDGTIGMTLLRPGWEGSDANYPAVYPVGCAGRVEQSEALPDGRYNVMLRGLFRFRLLGEQETQSYRRGLVQPLADPGVEPAALALARERLGRSLERASSGPIALIVQEELPDELFVNALCQSLPLEPVEHQSLLDCDSVLERCERLKEIIDYKALERTFGSGGDDKPH